MARSPICSVVDCDKPSSCKGMCRNHYQRQWYADRHGKKAEDRLAFLNSLVGTELQDCIVWPYTCDSHGYGRIWFDSKSTAASRVMCEIAHGQPPSKKMQAAHSCGQGHTGCVNPNHLRWATPKNNLQEACRHGTMKKVQHLNVNAIRAIRFLAKFHPHAKVAKRYGVSTSTISDISRRKTWAWVG